MSWGGWGGEILRWMRFFFNSTTEWPTLASFLITLLGQGKENILLSVVLPWGSFLCFDSRFLVYLLGLEIQVLAPFGKPQKPEFIYFLCNPTSNSSSHVFSLSQKWSWISFLAEINQCFWIEGSFLRCSCESVQLIVDHPDRKIHLFHFIFIHCFISAAFSFHFALHTSPFMAFVVEEKRARAIIEASQRRSCNKMISRALVW